jgi:hypothetical protein
MGSDWAEFVDIARNGRNISKVEGSTELSKEGRTV